ARQHCASLGCRPLGVSARPGFQASCHATTGCERSGISCVHAAVASPLFLSSRKAVSAVVKYELLRADGILVIQPESSLEAADFQRVAQEIDPYIEANGRLHGIMIDAKSFPGWKD